MVLGLSLNLLGGGSSSSGVRGSTNANSTNGANNGKTLALTLKLDDPLIDTLKFQQDQTVNNANSSRLVLSNRILHPATLSLSEEISYKVSVPNFSELTPLKLGSKYISDLIKIDSMTPSDIYGHNNTKDNGLDSYFFEYEKGLGDFSRYEKISSIRLPDKFFDEYNTTECISHMGLFPEIKRSWMSVDNKLILWNYELQRPSLFATSSAAMAASDPLSGTGPSINLSSSSSDFHIIDLSQIKHTILQVKLVKPKPNVFVESINHLLVVATSMEIIIFIVQHDAKTNTFEIFNPELSVSTQGLLVNNIIENPKTGDIYFTGESDGINIWRLDYSNKSTFTKNKCDKVCMTKSGFTSVLPYKMQPQAASGSSSSGTANSNGGNSGVVEHITALDLDWSRGILYSLSSKSVIRVYEISPGQEHFTKSNQLIPNEIFRGISSLLNDPTTSTAAIESFSKFRIMSIQHISKFESTNIQLIAITNYGCRILLRFGNTSSFPSFSSFTSSSTTSIGLKLNVSSIKFPPGKELPKLNPELDAFTRNKQYNSQLIINQRKSQLLKNTKFAKILSPGVFVCVKRTKYSDKFFICTTNYGFLKNVGKLIEDAEFIDFGGVANDASTSNTYIHDIIQLNASMNATETPTGYANVLATQFTKEPLRFAIVTNFGIYIYQYRTPDKILNSLSEETLEYFKEENGFVETCSTLLHLSCTYGNNNNDILKRNAQILFSTCGNNARLQQQQQQPQQQQVPQLGQQSQHPTIDQVILSDRFYGTCLLISRLFRNYWNTKVFTILPHIKASTNSMNGSLQIDLSSIKEDNLIIEGLSIDKQKVEFFIGSVMVLIDFFNENGNSIQGLNAPNYSSDPTRFGNEICLRGEHIAFTSILKSLNSIKEALSFVMFLIEETQINKSNFKDILKHLSLINQVNLVSLSFKDLLLPNTEVKNLIKELLSCIVNKSILKGGSIDLIATSLQGRCGSFCSTNDIIIFKAIENLTKAKNDGKRDNDLKIRCLDNAVKLFEQAYESLTLANIQNSVNIMVELEYYSGAVRMCLTLAHKLEINKTSTAKPATTELSVLSTDKPKPTLIHELYQIIFSILTKIDLQTIQITETNDQFLINDFIEIRDTTYETCFASKDQAFHYEFYQWFINQGVSDRLLSINTQFILPFLEEKSQDNLELTNLLWLYHSKRENYYKAASILYTLSILEFNLNLQQRIEYLSRANGFCNCVCPPNLRQKMIQLSSVVGELIEVANIQLDVLSTIQQDDRINKDNKQLASQDLNYKIKNISDLFNNYTDPLGYYDLCLYIVKISDHKNTEDILKRWELFFEKLFYESQNKSSKEPFYITLRNALISIGVKLSSSDLVFPVPELVKLICKYIQAAEDELDSKQQIPPVGLVVDIFVKSGVNYEKLYHIMKSMINYYSYDSLSKRSLDMVSGEMTYLIKNWFSNDKRLRELIPGDKIKALTLYTLASDPINEYLKKN